MHSTWTDAPGHIVVVNEHVGCVTESNESPQLVVRLLNGSCSTSADGTTMVAITGHAAESFDAFERLSLRLYRGPGPVPHVNQNSSAAIVDTFAVDQNKAADTGNASLSAAEVLHVAEAKEAQARLAAPKLQSFWSRLCTIVERLTHNLQLLRLRISFHKPGGDSGSVTKPVLPNSFVANHPGNNTLGRHLLGTGYALDTCNA